MGNDQSSAKESSHKEDECLGEEESISELFLSKLRYLEREGKHLTASIEKLESKVHNLSCDNDSLREQVAELTKALEKKESTNLDLEIEQGELASKISELEARMKRLETLQQIPFQSRGSFSTSTSYSSAVKSYDVQVQPALRKPLSNEVGFTVVKDVAQQEVKSAQDNAKNKTETQISVNHSHSRKESKNGNRSSKKEAAAKTKFSRGKRGVVYFDRPLPTELKTLCSLSKCDLCDVKLQGRQFSQQIDNANLHYWSLNHFQEVQKYLTNYYTATPELKPLYKPSYHYKVANRPLPKDIISQCNSDKCNICDQSFEQSKVQEHYYGSEHNRKVAKILHADKTPAFFNEWLQIISN